MIGQTIAPYRHQRRTRPRRDGRRFIARMTSGLLCIRKPSKYVVCVPWVGGTRRRMLAEARAASNLQSSRNYTIYESARMATASFLVMELVEGRTLRSLLSDGPLEPKRSSNSARSSPGLEAAPFARRLSWRQSKNARKKHRGPGGGPGEAARFR